MWTRRSEGWINASSPSTAKAAVRLSPCITTPSFPSSSSLPPSSMPIGLSLPPLSPFPSFPPLPPNFLSFLDLVLVATSPTSGRVIWGT